MTSTLDRPRTRSDAGARFRSLRVDLRGTDRYAVVDGAVPRHGRDALVAAPVAQRQLAMQPSP